MTALSLGGVSKTFGEVPALDDVTIDVAAGELLTIVGPSGSGKSTLLRCVAGLEAPDRGSVRIDGEDVTLTDPARRGVAMVFQGFALFPHLDVAQNIGFGLRARGSKGTEVDADVAKAATRLGLGDKLHRHPAELSGGERQRVALARGLVERPRVLLLDEPLSALDARLRTRAREEVRAVHDASGACTVLVTHDQAEALVLGDRVAVMDAGRLVQVGAPADVYDNPASVGVATFLGEPAMNFLHGDLAGSLGGRPGLTLGVRPEGLRVDGDGPVSARVSSVERAGHDVVWRLVAEQTTLALRPGAGTPDPRPGDLVAIAADPTALRHFDPDTGLAVRP